MVLVCSTTIPPPPTEPRVMQLDKDYVNYLMRKQGALKVPCPLACAFEFMESRSNASGKVSISESAKNIKLRAKEGAAKSGNNSSPSAQ